MSSISYSKTVSGSGQTLVNGKGQEEAALLHQLQPHPRSPPPLSLSNHSSSVNPPTSPLISTGGTLSPRSAGLGLGHRSLGQAVTAYGKAFCYRQPSPPQTLAGNINTLEGDLGQYMWAKANDAVTELWL
ncbi:unnamed protein product [Pleuronectes platessa]|uniref:Uncharacterized protein n=1 Tax=Pleuronectes platessa TaxID=8262 RepID=A0A9N7V7T5_PLEPL|nr:unnamed protein product [Pleuronectes platessa]